MKALESEAGVASPGRLLGRPGVRQFIKFCIVGASSTVIDVSISYFLTYHFLLWWVAAKTISFLLAVTNGFFWNRRWTFGAISGAAAHHQYALFVMVNAVGLGLNLTIMKTVFLLATGTWHHQTPTKAIWALGTLTATVIVVFWNFFANKHWTFKAHNPDRP